MSSAWEIKYSNSRNRPYFYNSTTKQSVWDKPDDIDEDQIPSLPGAQFLTAPPPAATVGKVRASHLLVKHRESRNPKSWKDPHITRTKDEAKEILRSHRQTLLATPDLGVAMAALARTESDCSSARDGGDLGWFSKNQMQKPFEEATFAMPVNTLSDIVETDSGVHLILRTG